MKEDSTRSVRTIAWRSLAIGFGTMILSAIVAGPRDRIEIVWPTVLALWIAAGAGSFMMAWTRSGAWRWMWASAGTVLLLIFVFISLLRMEDTLIQPG